MGDPDRATRIGQHFENLQRFWGDRAAAVAFRQRISRYARMLPRTKQLKHRTNRVSTPDEFHEIIGGYLRQDREESRHPTTCRE